MTRRRVRYGSCHGSVLSPLPLTRFEIAEGKKGRVNIDYHVDYDLRLYSVPHGLVGEHVDVRATATTVELFFEGRRVGCHRRSYGLRGTSVTLDEHQPKSHQQYGNWPPSRLIGWAEAIGPNAAAVVAAIMKDRPHPSRATARVWR